MLHRYLLLALLWLALTPAWATNPPDSLRQRLDYILGPLDKSQVPTGCLAEAAIPLLTLEPFNGTLTDSSLTDAQAFRMLYATLLTSRVAGTSALPTMQTMVSRWEAAEAAGTAIPVAIQRLDYATLRPDALSAGLLTVQNDQLYDVAGRSQSPYQKRTLFAAAPARSHSKSGAPSFIFPSNLYLRQGGSGSSQLSVDFGDGRGYVSVAWDTPVPVSYDAAGLKRIRVRITYPSTAIGFTTLAAPAPVPTFNSHFDFEVLNPVCSSCRYRDGGLDTLFLPTGQHSGATVSIRYGGDHTRLVKPLIVLEGYDIHQIAPKIQKENATVDDFMDDIDDNGLYNRLDDVDNTRGAQYDIVFIDFGDGADDIKRNALLFREVLAWVNTRKIPAAPGVPLAQNVVLGISMGGLVARYGLAQQEKAQAGSTQTRLLVTQDSPHRGANTPLGVQTLTRQAWDFATAYVVAGPVGSPVVTIPAMLIFPQLTQLNDVLDAPATQQLLLQRAENGAGVPSLNSFVDGEYRTMITPPASGFPYGFLALSLGSQCGVGNGLQPGQDLARVQTGAFFSPQPFLRRKDLRVDFYVRSLPNFGPPQPISELRYYADYHILTVIRVKVDMFRETAVAPGNLRFWDGLPGGTRFLASESPVSAGNNDFFLGPFFGIYKYATLAERFCFVPTVSALDIEDINSATVNGVYANDAASASRSTAARFLAQNAAFANRLHPYFTPRSARWLFNELQGLNNFSEVCTTECNPFATTRITGSELVCAPVGSTGQYSIANLPAGATVQWSVDPPGALTPTSPVTGPTFSVQNPGTTATSATIRATVGTCGFSLAFPVRIGEGLITLPRVEPVCNFSPVRIQAQTIGVNSNAYYVWTVDGVTSSNHGSELLIPHAPRNGSGVLRVQVSVDDACTNPLSDTTGVPYYDCNAPVGRYAVYPNPAADELTVEESQQAAFQATLYDAQGQARRQQNAPQGRLRLDTGTLPTGLYHLQLRRGQQVERRQVQVTH